MFTVENGEYRRVTFGFISGDNQSRAAGALWRDVLSGGSSEAVKAGLPPLSDALIDPPISVKALWIFPRSPCERDIMERDVTALKRSQELLKTHLME